MEKLEKKTRIDIALRLAWVFVGIPYRWGGQTPAQGFDCSGLMVEFLRATGVILPTADFTAHALATRFPRGDKMGVGSFVYYDWNNDGIYDHVEMIVAEMSDGKFLTVGASGGDSRTVNDIVANQMQAFVMIRPLKSKVDYFNNPLH